MPLETPRLDPSPHRGDLKTNPYTTYNDVHVMQENMDKFYMHHRYPVKTGYKSHTSLGLTAGILSLSLVLEQLRLEAVATRLLPPRAALPYYSTYTSDDTTGAKV